MKDYIYIYIYIYINSLLQQRDVSYTWIIILIQLGGVVRYSNIQTAVNALSIESSLILVNLLRDTKPMKGLIGVDRNTCTFDPVTKWTLGHPLCTL